MATETPNHRLIKPEMTDKADISMINPNWDTLDTALKAVEDRVENTHAIEESGSNENGTYVRFSDGTQICSINYLISSVPVTNALGAIYGNQNAYTWTYPATFSAYPSVSGLANSSVGGYVFVVASTLNSNSHMSYHIASATSATIPTVRVTLTAVGRWK